MLTKLAKTLSSIQIFFPIKALPGSPYGQRGRTWETSSGQPDIKFELETLLRSDSDVVRGYSIRRVDGVWINEESGKWETDEVCEIIAYVSPGFVKDLRENPKSASCRFVARLGQLSCVDMGHGSFWCIIDGRSLEEFSREGIQMADKIISFNEILSD
jgi:hypothetical protein